MRSGAKERGGGVVPPGTLFGSSGIVGERATCVFVCFFHLVFRLHHSWGSFLGVLLVDGYHARCFVEKQSRMRSFCPRTGIFTRIQVATILRYIAVCATAVCMLFCLDA